VSSEEIARPAASAADEPGEATIDRLPAASETQEEPAGSRIAGVASTIADAAGPVISAALTPVRSLASGANRAIAERPGARVRHVREMGRHDLADLWELHPEARRASIRELGLVSVPVEKIKGTAVEGCGSARR